MANFKIARPGHGFVDGPINLSWGANAPASDVQQVKPAQMTPRFKARVLAGLIVETKDPVTVGLTNDFDDVRTYRLLTGEEARAHKAIPPGEVTRKVYDPSAGDLVDVPIGGTKDLSAALGEVAESDAGSIPAEQSPGDVESVSEHPGAVADDDTPAGQDEAIEEKAKAPDRPRRSTRKPDAS